MGNVSAFNSLYCVLKTFSRSQVGLTKFVNKGLEIQIKSHNFNFGRKVNVYMWVKWLCKLQNNVKH